jgi:hypothetical protein
MSAWTRLVIACALSCSATAATAQEQIPLLPRPTVSPCSNAERPELPEKWRATYLMAPFTSGQLVVGDLIHDASLSAMRVRLFGLRSGALDLLIAGAETYLLESNHSGTACRRLGDTGWRPFPPDWLTPQSQCVGSAPITGTAVDWWKAPLDPAPSGYWIWTRTTDRTPFRFVFQSASDRLAPFSHYAMSYQKRFERLEHSELASIVQTCQANSVPAEAGGADGLRGLMGKMEHAGSRAESEIASLMPELSACPAAPFTRWPERVGIAGILTPFDVVQDPAPTEVLYDWSIPAQRTRAFLPPQAPVSARDALLIGKDGYDILYPRHARAVCAATLPGTVRPDWQDRAPCTCEATLNGKTELSPHGTTRILSCPLASPRLAWAWYTLEGRPEVFMVTSLPGDEGSGLFAVLDYHEWLPEQSFPRGVFKKPAQCTAPRRNAPSPAPPDCSTCHAGPTAEKLKKSGLSGQHPEFQ